jgi:WD40 repeat protein
MGELMIKRYTTLFTLLFILTGCIPGPIQTIEQTEALSPEIIPSPTYQNTIAPTLTVITPQPQTAPADISADFDCTTEEEKPGVQPTFKDGKLVRLGRGRIFGMDWSRDGRILAVASETGIYLLDAQTMQQISSIDTGDAVEVVKFSPSGKTLASGDGSQLILWDVKSLKQIGIIGEDIDYYSTQGSYPSNAELGNISFSPDGKQVVVHQLYTGWYNDDRRVQIWDVDTQKIVREWKTEEGSTAFFLPDAVFSPDGKYISSPWMDGIQIWDVVTGESVRYVGGRDYANFSPDGRQIVTLTDTGVKIVDLRSNETLFIHVADSYDNASAFFSADGSMLVTQYSTLDYSYLDIWDAHTGQHLTSIKDLPYLYGLAFNPQANELVTFDYKQQINTWNIQTGALIGSFTFSDFVGSEVYPSNDESTLVVRNEDAYDLYDAKNGQYRCRLLGTAYEDVSVSFNPYGTEFAAFSRSGEVTVWDSASGELVQEIAAGQLLPEGFTLLQRHIFEMPKYSIDFIAWAWTQPDGTIGRWIGNSCDVLEALPTRCQGVISPDGKYIAVRVNRSIDIVSTYTKDKVASIGFNANNMSFSADGSYLLELAFLDYSIDIWKISTGEKIQNINKGLAGEGPILGVQEFTFSADGSRMVSYLPYYHQESVKVWNTKTWTLDKAFDTMAGVGDSKISADGNLVTALSGYVIYLWRMDEVR